MTTSLSTRVNTNATYAPTVNGAPLSSSQIDNNFISLAVNKLEAGNNLSELTNVTSALANLSLSPTSSVQFGSFGVGTAASGTSGEIRATNQITSFYSDERLKENIKVIPNALEKVIQLRGVTYNANQIAEKFGFSDKTAQVGVIAGDVEKVLPEAVKPAPFDIMRLQEGIEISRSGENYKTVQYEKIVPLLIEAIKELNMEIKNLKGIN